jgi:hypothetical protein
MGYDMAMIEDYNYNLPSDGYFRLNIFGMSKFRGMMHEAGMLAGGDPPAWPRLADYGIDPDSFLDTLTNETTSPAEVAFIKANEDVKHATADSPGIAYWKLCSNDGWVVTAAECDQAVKAWEAWSADNLSENFFESDDTKVYWYDWIDYLRAAAAHNGFGVY